MYQATITKIDGTWVAQIHDGPTLQLTSSAVQEYDSWLLKLAGRDQYASKKEAKIEAERLAAEKAKQAAYSNHRKPS